MLLNLNTIKLCSLNITFIFKSVLFLMSLLTNVYSQKNIVSLSQTYDLDNDGLSEFIAIEKQNFNDNFPTSAVYYEIDKFGTHIELWRYTNPNYILNTEVGDINGDGLPEILVMSNLNSIEFFNWTGVDFSPLSSGFINIANSFPKNHTSIGFSNIDIDSDNINEIILSFNSPNRKISLNYVSKNSNLSLIQDFSSNIIAEGYSPIISHPVNVNGDDWVDFIAISPEINKIRIQLYINNSGTFIKSLSGLPKTPFSTLQIIQSGVFNLDIDNDGEKEIVLPIKNKPTIAIKKLITGFKIIQLSEEMQKLFYFNKPLNDDQINEVLKNRAKLGNINNPIQKITLNTTKLKKNMVNKEESVISSNFSTGSSLEKIKNISDLNLTPLNITPVDTNKELKLNQLSEVNLKSIKASSSIIDSLDTVYQSSIPAQDSMLNRSKSNIVNKNNMEDSILKESVNKIKPLQLNTLGVTQVEPTNTEDIIDTLYINEPFTLSVKPSKGTILSFNPESLPMGAKFEQISKTITWIPVLSQTGLQTIQYSLIVEGAIKPTIEEVAGESLTAQPSSSAENFKFNFFIKER